MVKVLLIVVMVSMKGCVLYQAVSRSLYPGIAEPTRQHKMQGVTILFHNELCGFV